jgi:hypothetical protein
MRLQVGLVGFCLAVAGDAFVSDNTDDRVLANDGASDVDDFHRFSVELARRGNIEGKTPNHRLVILTSVVTTLSCSVPL